MFLFLMALLVIILVAVLIGALALPGKRSKKPPAPLEDDDWDDDELNW